MNNRSYALRAGLFVLVFTIAILVAAFWMGGNHEPRVPYVVVTNGSVFGLRTQSTVFFRGISAGVVRKILVDPKDPQITLIYVSIDKKMPVTQGTYAELKLQGVTGLSALELNTTPNLKPLATSGAHPGIIPMRSSLFTRLAKTGARTMKELASLSRALRQTFNATNRKHLQTILANTAQVSQEWVVLSRQLNQAAAGIPGLEKRTDTALTNISRLTDEMRALGGRLQTLAKTAQGAGNLLLTRTLPKINHAADQLGAASNDVRKLSRSLRHHPRELLLGVPPRPPGPGEPGYKESR
ncbi:MAG TPA: MlaD family protein [Acidiferrobacter sp.]|nr:MlaD family protein [Acidiferrobacter sp.]